MKRRNWMGHQRSTSRGRKALGPLAKRIQKKRKSYSFERLEDRFYFSGTPNDLQTVTLSSSTPEGAAAILLREQMWNTMQASAGASAGAGQGSSASQVNQLYAPNSIPLPAGSPDDPLFPDQWHLLNTGQEVGRPEFEALVGIAGQDINVLPVWTMQRDDGGVGYTGKGVVVAVIDTGVQVGHPDLADNISDTLRFNAVTGSSNGQPYLFDPGTGLLNPGAFHGTAVAGLIGAVANNGIGGTGVAPDVTLVPIAFLTPASVTGPTGSDPQDSIVRAFQYALDHGVDITNNSWGPAVPRNAFNLTDEQYAIFRQSVIFGRDGLGMINVFSSGNGAAAPVGPFANYNVNYDSASYNAILNSRYVIGVTGIDHDGQYANADGSFTSYPNAGASVLVAAPTGSNVAQDVADDTGQGSGLWTTDLVGDFGLNAAPLPNGFDRDQDPLADANYTSRMNGTSASAPLVSGVIALMLEANPNLTFRDVQEILLRSARTTAWYEVPDASRGDVITGGNEGSGLGNGLSGGSASSGSTGSSGTNLGAPGGGQVVVTDWGDAPQGFPTSPFAYPVTSFENGPNHAFDTTNPNPLRLGDFIDDDPATGQHSAGAAGDDAVTAGGLPDDEDGILSPIIFGQNPSIFLVRGEKQVAISIVVHGIVPLTDPRVNLWIDWAPIADQGWDPSSTGGEWVIQDQPVQNGTNVFLIDVPDTAEVGTTYARIRLTSQPNVANLPTGSAPDGEVEDWPVAIFSNSTGGGGGGSTLDFFTTWQTNQTGPFRDPDPYFHSNPPPGFISPNSAQTTGFFQKSLQWMDPLADPSIESNFPDSPPVTGHSDPNLGNDFGRQVGSHYELMPGLFANGAGYTVSQGYGPYGDQTGYAHGVVDAELAVQMAKQWHTLGQNMAPMTERTVTTFTLGALPILAAEEMANNGMLVPGGIGTRSGYISYWNEYNADPPAPFDPASAASWPIESRGLSYEDFAVAPKEQINVEWVEVKVTITGNPANLDFLRLMLTSPEGTQSELNHYFEDPSFGLNSAQVLSNPQFTRDPAGNISDGTFVWTFSSNRNWGESTNAAVILNPITGEPVAGPGGDPIFRNWELHVENWGAAPMTIANLEIVWHGKEVAAPTQYLKFDPNFPATAPGLYTDLAEGQNAWDRRWLDQGTKTEGWEIPMAQRIQGSVGIDSTPDGEFNFDRYVQEINPARSNFQPYNASIPRANDIRRRPDFTDVNQNGIFDAGTDVKLQEEFASNVVVSLYRVDKTTGLPEAAPTAYFLTGADGNFYFDVDPTYTWVVKINDPENRQVKDDVTQPAGYMKDYQTSWTITPDWFFAPDHDNTFNANTLGNFVDGQLVKPGEVVWGMSDANGDGTSTLGPMPYLYDMQVGQGFGQISDPVPMAVKNINFLLAKSAAVQDFTVDGTVFADLNNDSVFNGNDALLPNVSVYIDANRNGAYENGEKTVLTDANGHYSLLVQSAVPGTYSIGVRLPGVDWQFKAPSAGAQELYLPQSSSAGPTNFALTPPTNAFPNNAPPASQARILGYVFDDQNGNGTRQLSAQGTQGELGKPGVRVFIDANKDGIWQNTEVSTITASNGSFEFDNVTPANDIWVDVAIDNEGTANAPLVLTTPQPLGHILVAVGNGGTFINAAFGVFDRAGDDWGDLAFQTTDLQNGPHHKVVPGFQLGATNTGEVNGVAGADNASDDGVVVVGGVLTSGVNTLTVTVNGVGGLLTGWMDFNGNNQFDGDSEKLEWKLNGVSLGKEADLNPGTYNLQITVPTSASPHQVAARFRWGEPGLSFTGPAAIGEVEDYMLTVNPSAGDYDHNGVVDGGDFNLWKKQNGSNVAPFSGADGNGDGVVDQADYDVWAANYGRTYPGAGSGAAELMAGEGGNQDSAPGAGLAASAGLGETSSSAGQALGAGLGTSVGSAASSDTLSPAFVAYASQSSSVAPASTSVVRTSSASGASSDSDLLLLDQTWASTDGNSFDSDHESLYSDESHEVVSTNDLALAAVLNENDEWWNTL